jgi:hypothetical protein
VQYENVEYIGNPEANLTYKSETNSLEPISKLFEEDNKAGKLDKAKEIVGLKRTRDS